ncbi:hypothetical protein VTN02DRAFT_6282 [Thermoascus thermophilus]
MVQDCFPPSQHDRYFNRFAEFRALLGVCVHIMAGQPSCAPEVLSIQHRNTAHGTHWNVFIPDGMVTFVTRYHKGFYASNDVKLIHRYVPRAVGEPVIWYLWLVLPFIQQLKAYTHAHTAGSTPQPPEDHDDPNTPSDHATDSDEDSEADDDRDARDRAVRSSGAAPRAFINGLDYLWGPDPNGRPWTSE